MASTRTSRQAFAMPPSSRQVGTRRTGGEVQPGVATRSSVQQQDHSRPISNHQGQPSSQRPTHERPQIQYITRKPLVSAMDRHGWVMPLPEDELPDWETFQQHDTHVRNQNELRPTTPRSVLSTASGVTISASGLHAAAQGPGAIQTKARIHRSGSVDILIPSPRAGDNASPRQDFFSFEGVKMNSPGRSSTASRNSGQSRPVAQRHFPEDETDSMTTPHRQRVSYVPTKPPANYKNSSTDLFTGQMPNEHQRMSVGAKPPSEANSVYETMTHSFRQSQGPLSHGPSSHQLLDSRSPMDKAKDIQRFFADQQKRLDRTLQFERDRQLHANYSKLFDLAAPPGAKVTVSETKQDPDKQTPANTRSNPHIHMERPQPRPLINPVEEAVPIGAGLENHAEQSNKFAEEVSFWELRKRRQPYQYEQETNHVQDIQRALDKNPLKYETRSTTANADIAHNPDYIQSSLKASSPATLGIAWLQHEFKACINKLFESESAWTSSPRMRHLPVELKREQGLYSLWCILDEALHSWVQRDRYLRNINKEGAEMSQRALRQAHEGRRAEKLSLQSEYVQKIEEAKKEATDKLASQKEEYETRIKDLEDRRRAFELKCIELATEKKQRESADARFREETVRVQQAQEKTQKQIDTDRMKALEKAESQIQALQKENLSLRTSREVESSSTSQRIRSLEAELLRVRDEMGIDHAQEIAELKEQHAKRYREIEAKMQQLVEEHDKFVRQLELDHQQRTSAVRKEHNMQLEMARRSTAAAEKSIQQLKDRHTEQLRRFHAQQRSREAAYEKDLLRVRKQNRKISSSFPPPPPPPSQRQHSAFPLSASTRNVSVFAASKVNFKSSSISPPPSPPRGPPPSAIQSNTSLQSKTPRSKHRHGRCEEGNEGDKASTSQESDDNLEVKACESSVPVRDQGEQSYGEDEDGNCNLAEQLESQKTNAANVARTSRSSCRDLQPSYTDLLDRYVYSMDDLSQSNDEDEDEDGKIVANEDLNEEW